MAQDWRRRVELWSLSTKVAWDATRYLTVEQLTGENGKDMVLAALDQTFAEADDVNLLESADEFFYLCCRSPGEDVVSYQSKLDTKLRRLESTCSVRIPDHNQKVFGAQMRLPGRNLADELENADIGVMSALEAGDS
eukprot:141804-Amphidinium_carterae.1